MTRSAKAFFWSLPAILILAHDVVIFFTSGNPFAFSEIGWFLETYMPDIHDGLARAAGEEYYGNFLKPLFELKSFFFFGAIAAIVCIWQFCFTQIEQPHANVPLNPRNRNQKLTNRR